ncbi:hypothetical protein STRIP9103_01275 [Streptomyces ipomoeae 91-03]|uniref:Uncharacterized protein n=1 Tax=Streptomyces ipomoeae 91-03 TaxID=698759 RepID=L1KQS3_9ACTN|nr:hypothetical protein STRIP9103_01275 [Streptomyces ipomoeae 91-03]
MVVEDDETGRDSANSTDSATRPRSWRLAASTHGPLSATIGSRAAAATAGRWPGSAGQADVPGVGGAGTPDAAHGQFRRHAGPLPRLKAHDCGPTPAAPVVADATGPGSRHLGCSSPSAVPELFGRPRTLSRRPEQWIRS